MANKKISELPTASTISSGEYLEIIQGGTNKKLLLDQIAFTVTTWNGVTFPTATGPTIYIVTADHGIPNDADYIPAGAWAIALTAGVTTYSSLYIKP